METVLIADDHEIIRRGVKTIIESFRGEYNFIEASTCVDVMKVMSDRQVHYAVLDMFLADGNIFPSIQQLSESNSQTGILIYSMNAETIYGKRLLGKGVRGFVSKQDDVVELENALRTLLKGEIYLSAKQKERLFNTKALTANPIDSLSDRELEVVEYVSAGMGTKEIANKMNLDITTVSTYRRRAFEKLNVQNAIELNDKFLLYKMQ